MLQEQSWHYSPTLASTTQTTADNIPKSKIIKHKVLRKEPAETWHKGERCCKGPDSLGGRVCVTSSRELCTGAVGSPLP